MVPTHCFTRLSSLALLLFSVAVRGAPTGECCTKEFTFTNEHRESMMLAYTAIWNGDFSNVNNTLMDTLDVHLDRYPVGNHSVEQNITTPTEFTNLIGGFSLADWESVKLTPLKWVGQDNMVALHWDMTAVMSDNFTKIPT